MQKSPWVSKTSAEDLQEAIGVTEVMSEDSNAGTKIKSFQQSKGPLECFF